MAKLGNVGQLKSSCNEQHTKSIKLSPCSHKVAKAIHKKKRCITSSNKDWYDARCSICMESPHNSVLLLCSSYNKGCRPYMCSTSPRFSNCLDQYQKAYTKLTSLFSAEPSNDKEDVPQLCCPICRGQVKGWAVVEKARADLNKKKRSCMQENCSFVGNYKQLKKHVKAEHPLSRPRDVDPEHEEKWKTLEGERERNDAISAITSADPSAIILGDFVIEGGPNPFFRNFGIMDGFINDNRSNSSSRSVRINSMYEDDDMGNHHGDVIPVSRHRYHRRLLMGRIGRRGRGRRHRGNLEI